jgi:dienelactone hydrolase
VACQPFVRLQSMHKRLLTLMLCFLILGGCAAGTSRLSPVSSGIEVNGQHIPAALLKPDGPGPFPAVVIMHDCSGLGPLSSGGPDRWAKELVKQGYVVITPDSFTPRGYPNGVCTDSSPGRARVNPFRRVPDAYAALAHLRTLPYVDGSRVGVMGGSHGGSTTLTAVVAPGSDRDLLAKEKRAGFAAAVALYPGCEGPLGPWRASRQTGVSGPVAEYTGVYRAVTPLLILIGEKDDWTPAETCRKLTEVSQAAGYPVTIKIYPGAHHSFDSDRPVRYLATRVNGNSPNGRGATTGGNPEAWADSIREVTAFFGRCLGKR